MILASWRWRRIREKKVKRQQDKDASHSVTYSKVSLAWFTSIYLLPFLFFTIFCASDNFILLNTWDGTGSEALCKHSSDFTHKLNSQLGWKQQLITNCKNYYLLWFYRDLFNELQSRMLCCLATANSLQKIDYTRIIFYFAFILNY